MRLLVLCLAVSLLFVVTVFAADQYNRQVSVTGGSPQRLSTVLLTAGYTGVMSFDELVICNPTGAAGTLFVGEPDVTTTNGFPLTAGGECWRQTAADRPIDATRIYLRSATTQSAAISLRSR